MKKVMKRLLALLMWMAVLFTAIPCNEVLATEENVPAITVTSTTVTAGNYAYFYVDASNFTDMVGLEYTLYYDADVMTPNWIYADSSFVSSSSKDINKDTAGEIKCSIMNIDGLNGNGQLLRMGFWVSADAEPGTYSMTLTIGDAYDSNFNEISIAKTSGTLTVNPSEPTATSISFFSVCDKTTVSKGDTFTYTLKAGYTYGLACGNFEFQYDRDLLELVDVSLGKELLTETAIYNVNKDTAGYVKITYADIEAISSSYGIEYFKLTFAVKENVDATTNIEFAADSLVDANLANMKTNSLTRKITIEELEEEVTYPALKVKVNEIAVDGSFTADVILEAGANVAAGDFTITYDKNQIVCQSVDRDAALTENGGYLITKETIDTGSVQFSYVNQNPFSVEQRIAVLKFQADEKFYGDTIFRISGKDVVDVNYTDITLEYDSVTAEIPVRMISLNCTLVGPTYYIGDVVAVEDFHVVAVCNDDSTKEITDGYMISDVNTSIAGAKEVEIVYQHLSTTCNVVVTSPSIEISKENISIIAGYTDTLTATTLPEGQVVEWSSADNTIATVVDGVVKGLKVGKTMITAQFTYNGIAYTDTCEVEVTEAILVDIELVRVPNKTTYWVGDALDITGMELKLTYSDEGTETITSGFVISGYDSSAVGTKKVTVTYGDFTVTFDVAVTSPSIEISKEDISIIAGYTDTLTAATLPEGQVVEWSSADNTIATVVDGVVKGLKVGKTMITAQFTYSGIAYTDTCEVEVTEAILVDVELARVPNKTTYWVGDALDTTGMELKLTYSDETTETVTAGFLTSGYDLSAVGTKAVTVTYGDFTVTFDVAVTSPRIEISKEDISIIAGYTDTLNAMTAPSGQVVAWSSADDTIATVVDGVVKGLKVGKTMITAQFTYNGIEYTDTCEVEVTEAILVGIELISVPSKTLYWVGDALDTTGLSLKLTYSDETTEIVTEGYTVRGFDSSGVGTKEITVIYAECSTTYEVTITDILIGDVNNDGEVNNLDRQILTRHLAKWAGYEADKLNLKAADVNQDGEVNNLDRQILTRHLAKWAGYEELPYLSNN